MDQFLKDHFLWVAGLPGHVRPLHRLEAQGVAFVITEEARMHLIWSSRRVHLMPLDRTLMDYSRFRICFCEPSKTQESQYGAALGLLLSYVQLVVFESDLRLAQKSGLIREDLTIEQWTSFTTDIMRNVHERSLDQLIPPRWNFGLLRLGAYWSLVLFLHKSTNLVHLPCQIE